MRKCLMILMLFVASSKICLAQTKKGSSNKSKSRTSTSNQLIVVDSSTFTIKSTFTTTGAKSKISSGKIKILFPGGFGGMPDFDNKEDRAFQNKYKVEFYSQGCLRSGDYDEEGYNKVIFKYLDSKYGASWRKEIRTEAIGLKNFLIFDL